MTRARSGHEAHPVHGSDRSGRDPVAARDCDRARGVSRRRRRGGAVKKPNRIRPSRQTIGIRSVTHGHTRGRTPSPTYRSWAAMMTRCFNPRHDTYAAYGGRGIKVCDRWLRFENFLSDMGERPSPHHSLDRFPDGCGDYDPDNCRWATRSQQCLNRKTTRPVIREDGVRFLSIKEAAEDVGANRRCIRDCCTGRQKSHLGMTYRYDDEKT